MVLQVSLKTFVPKVKKFKLGPILAGIFLFFFLLIYSLYVPLPSPDNPLIFYNSEKRIDLNQVLKKTIYEAKQSITLHTYSLTDLTILSILKKKGKARNHRPSLL